jgi:UDP-N-acetylglucosamine 2-epimerase (non-hydrolysing)
MIAAASPEILCVVGARPNFMKIAPLMAALKSAPRPLRACLLHTGQHYDVAMNERFFEQLRIPAPDISLEVGSGSHAVQTAEIMKRFEPVLDAHQPDCVLVVGDVNSTIACALVASKLGVPIAHVEAGLRSYDRRMPEEVNRLVTDCLADLLLTPSADADRNLVAEGVDPSRIHLVGNIMIDTLMRHLPMATLERLNGRVNVTARSYGVLTLHRPSNVDDPAALAPIVEALRVIGSELPVVFPVHPRTRQRLESFGVAMPAGMILTEPLGYIDFLSLTSNARVILTDSGGLQEESTALGIPCLTLRENTERPATVDQGTNRVVGMRTDAILAGFRDAMSGRIEARRPPLWDGHTAPRAAAVLTAFLAR